MFGLCMLKQLGCPVCIAVLQGMLDLLHMAFDGLGERLLLSAPNALNLSASALNIDCKR